MKRSSGVIVNLIVMLAVEVFFIYQGIRILLQGQYAFAILWLLICSLPFIKSIQSFIYYLRNGVMKQPMDETNQNSCPSLEQQRLRKVEALYNQGLLTREEYEAKRKEIIDQI